eukprot:1856314-Prymnesium_polylepis.1
MRRRNCPVCNVDFSPKRIRNRAVEDVIRNSMTSCEQCKQPMTRAELALHTPCMLYANRLIEKKFGDRVEKYCGLQGFEKLSEVAFHSGETVFYEDDKVVRKEFRSPHMYDGCTEFYEDGEMVRKEYRSPH